jgi:iron complex outermembrane recepter protein
MRQTAFASAASIIAMMTTMAQAQTTQADAGQGSANDIIVTAQRKSERLQDVPVSVAVQSGAQLQSGGLRTLEDMTSRLPNVRIAPVPGGDAINIRGVGSGNNLGFEQSVATFVDGVYRSRARASKLGFFDVERVEILRGPQTTYFGNNAIAGALNITTRRPGKAFEYNASALYAPTDGEYSFEGGVSVPLTDRFSIRVAGRASGMWDGYIRNEATGGKGPDLDDKIGRVALRWEPNDAVHVDARVDHGRMRDAGIYNSELLFCPPDPAFGGPRGACARDLAASGGAVDDRLDWKAFTGPSYLHYDYTEAMLRITAETEGHRLTAISGYFEHDFDQLQNVVPTRNGSVTPGIDYGLSTRSLEHLRQYSQEVRFESTEPRPISYMVGAYYMHDDLRADTRSGYWFARNFATYVRNTQQDDLFSLFAASTMKLTDKFKVNLGARWSRVDKSATRDPRGGTSNYYLTDAAFTPITGVPGNTLLGAFATDLGNYAQPHRSDSKFMPSVNVQYAFSTRVMAYASYAKGFKAGGYAFNTSSASFDPETVDAFEVGVKSSFLDNAVTFNIAGFHSKYKDLQEATYVILPNGTPKSSIANVAASTAQGIELGGAVRPMRGLQLTFDLAYLSSQYDSYPIAPCTALGSLQSATCVQDMSGKDRAYAPKLSGNVGIGYAAPLFGDYQTKLETNVFFTSRYFEQANGDPLSIQRAYAKWDARIGFGPQRGQWEIAVIGKNLTDEVTAGYRSAVPSSAGSYQALTDRPRSVAIQLSIKG